MTVPGEISLPRTWRPFGARIVGTLLGALLLLLVVAVWVAWGDEVRSTFSASQRVTLIGIGFLGFVAWFAIVRSRVTADEHGVTVVNGYRRRAFEWSQVVSVNLRRGAPWAGLDLSDGTSVSMFGIQGSDGQRAIRAVRELRHLVETHTPTGDGD